MDSCTIASSGVDLNVNSIGAKDLPPLIMLHGIRDVGLSLLPVAEQLASQYRIHVLDLRGHGASGRAGSYAMAALLYDLHLVIETLCDSAPAVLGHSLGGQITTRFAATFPQCVRAAVIVEGVGPPPSRLTPSPRAILDREAQRILRIMTARMRSVNDLDTAVARLQKNNPRLAEQQAQALAEAATQENATGSRDWAFDPRAQSVFLAARDAKFYWPLVSCPTLLIAGALAHEYWQQATPANEHWDGRFTTEQLDTIANTFTDGRWLQFEHSGHMVHFDEPDRLARETAAFLAQHYG